MLALTDSRVTDFCEELLASLLAAFRSVIIVCEGEKLTWKCDDLVIQKEKKNSSLGQLLDFLIISLLYVPLQ